MIFYFCRKEKEDVPICTQLGKGGKKPQREIAFEEEGKRDLKEF